LCVAIIALNDANLNRLRDDTLRSTEQRLQGQATLLAEAGDRALKVLDLSLSIISHELEGAKGTEVSPLGIGNTRIQSLLEESGSAYPRSRIALIGSDGKVISHTSNWPGTELSVAERDFFRAFQADPARQTFAVPPAGRAAPADGQLYLARRVRGAGGFDGLVLAIVSLRDLTAFFRSLAPLEGSIVELAYRDPTAPKAAASRSPADVAPSPQSGPQVDAAAGDGSLVATAPVAGYPLAVVVGQPEPEALRSWRNLADHSTAMAVARTFFVLLMTWLAASWWQKQRNLTRELRRQNLRFDTALNNMSQGLCLFDRAKRLIVCNRRYSEMYGVDPERVRPGTTLREIVDLRYEAGGSPTMTKEDYVAWRDGVTMSDEPSDSIVEMQDGRAIEIHHRPMPGGGWLATHDDISERRKLSASLEQNHKLLGERTSLLQAIIDNFPGGIGFFDSDLRVIVCNERAKIILHLPEELFADGPPKLEDIVRFNARRGEYGPGDVEQQVADALAFAKGRRAYRFEWERPDGTVLDVRGAPIDNGGFIVTYMDITERYRSEARIAHMARHDVLTGLPNRLLLNERLEQALERSEVLAVHLLDLDRFKAVNDTLGHPAGDKLLRLVANRLRSLVRPGDTIARMGGDEFAILQAAAETPADATALAQRVIDTLSKAYDIDGHEVIIGTSVGIAMAPGDGASSEVLIRDADLSLYQAKDNGRGTFHFFEPAMAARMQARHALANDLRNALAEGQFRLYYQPMVRLDDNEIRGFEALIRWHHPRNGIVPPDTFIPLAEDTGLIMPLGEWTIREACSAAAKWPAEVRIAVNLSPAQFRSPRLPQLVVNALAASGLAPERLELEINEMALWEDTEAALEILYQLRGLGVRIAMDDFGTGHSSLNYLQSFPFDRIKIDRSFVKDITDRVGSLKIVRAVSTLAQALGMETTVEGIERAEQLAAVRSEGCTEMQGFFFSRAVPAEELEQQFFSDRSKTPRKPAAA